MTLPPQVAPIEGATIPDDRRVTFSTTLNASEIAMMESRRSEGESTSNLIRRLVILGVYADIRAHAAAKKS